MEVTHDGAVKVKLTGACGGCPMSQTKHFIKINYLIDPNKINGWF